MRLKVAFWPVVYSKLINFHFPDPIQGLFNNIFLEHRYITVQHLHTVFMIDNQNN